MGSGVLSEALELRSKDEGCASGAGICLVAKRNIMPGMLVARAFRHAVTPNTLQFIAISAGMQSPLPPDLTSLTGHCQNVRLGCPGEEISIYYGNFTASEFLLDYGFIPPETQHTAGQDHQRALLTLQQLEPLCT